MEHAMGKLDITKYSYFCSFLLTKFKQKIKKKKTAMNRIYFKMRAAVCVCCSTVYESCEDEERMEREARGNYFFFAISAVHSRDS